MSAASGSDDRLVDILLAEYQRLNEDRKVLVDIRFKLVVLVPTLTTIAVSLAKDQPSAMPIVAVAGMIATLSIVIYEVRNTQLHDWATHSLNMVRYRLGLELDALPYRPKRSTAKKGGYNKILRVLPVKHDFALATIYGLSMAAWTGLAITSISAFFITRYAWALDLSRQLDAGVDLPVANSGHEWARWLSVLLSILAGIATGRAIWKNNEAFGDTLRNGLTTQLQEDLKQVEIVSVWLTGPGGERRPGSAADAAPTGPAP